ncbi:MULTISPECIES: transcriptional initiation protein Tat [Vibrio]|uniref:Transcriptional initiation protein Tat n=1 Tax=Vibrio algicola TaxID=2662262 RepID=A0A5Q0TI53_9VIBR|nr:MULTISPECIES: transcriptional initiation protein Tat [Vibrio]MBD1575578.1 transcriptional initiation protein Tat [Vibrio sp. S11_S32]
MKTSKPLDQSVNESRRGLLKGMTTAVVVGGAVAAGLSGSAVASEPKAQNTEQPKLKKGYHETQHIRDYFDSL